MRQELFLGKVQGQWDVLAVVLVLGQVLERVREDLGEEQGGMLLRSLGDIRRELYLEAPDEFVGSQVIVDRLATDRVYDLLAHRVRIRAVSGVV